MNCKKCGSQINGTDKFCTCCGEKVEIVNNHNFKKKNKLKWWIPLLFFLSYMVIFWIRVVIRVLMMSNGNTEALNSSPLMNILTFLQLFSGFLVVPSLIVVIIIKNIQSSKETQIDYNSMDQLNNSNISIEDQLLISYIGDNYQKIVNKKFNFSAFFFSTFYLLYRKFYSIAIIQLLLIYISSFISEIVCGIVIYSLPILTGIFFNKYYVLYCKSKIKKLQLSNASLSNNELNNLCIKKGGTSILWAIIIYIVWVVFLQFVNLVW